MKALLSYFTAIAAVTMLASGATAGTIVQWNFNDSGTTPNVGSGVIEGVGSGIALPFTGTNNGSPGDTTGGGANGAATRTAAAPGSASASRGVQATASTAGLNTPTVSWHLLGGYRTSRYYQVYATTDGVNYNPVPTGVGSAATVLGSGSETSILADVSNDGLVTIVTDNNLIPSAGGDAFVYELSYTFPTGTAYDNNPNFGVQINAVHDPFGSDYVSAFFGTPSVDTVNGYTNSTSAGGGSVRYDLVTISAVPEPTGLALAVCGLALGGVRRRR